MVSRLTPRSAAASRGDTSERLPFSRGHLGFHHSAARPSAPAEAAPDLRDLGEHRGNAHHRRADVVRQLLVVPGGNLSVDGAVEGAADRSSCEPRSEPGLTLVLQIAGGLPHQGGVDARFTGDGLELGQREGGAVELTLALKAGSSLEDRRQYRRRPLSVNRLGASAEWFSGTRRRAQSPTARRCGAVSR